MAFWTVNTAPFYIIGLRRQENGILNPVLNASFRMGEKIVPACVQTPEIQWRISSFTIVMSPRGGAGGGFHAGGHWRGDFEWEPLAAAVRSPPMSHSVEAVLGCAEVF